jgi:hypothetical protein
MGAGGRLIGVWEEKRFVIKNIQKTRKTDVETDAFAKHYHYGRLGGCDQQR